MMRGLGREFLIYGTGDILVKGAMILILPLYTRLLPPDAYGALALLVTLTALGTAILGLGSDAVFLRFYFLSDRLDDLQTLTATWLFFLVGWTGLAVVLVGVFGDAASRLAFGAPGHGPTITLALLAIPPTLANVILGQVLRNRFKPVTFITTNIASTAIEIAAGVLLATRGGLGVAGILWGVVLGELALLPLRAWLTRDLLRGVRVSPSLLRRLLLYGLPLVPASVSYWIVAAADRILLTRMTGLATVGIYGVANIVGGGLVLAIGSFGRVWAPRIISVYETDRDQAARFMGRAFTGWQAAMAALCVCITALAPQIVHVIAAPIYGRAALAVGPLALAGFAYSTTQMTGCAISLIGRTVYIAIAAGVAAVTNIVLCLILIPPFGMLGAAWATTGAYVAMAVVYFAIAQRLWRVPYETRRVSILIAATIGASLLVMNVPTLGRSIFDAALRLIYAATFAAASASVAGLTPLQLLRVGLSKTRRRPWPGRTPVSADVSIER